MEEKLQSRIKIDRELFYRLKVISTRWGKSIPECIKEWVGKAEKENNNCEDESGEQS